MEEKIIINDESGDKKYFTQLPHYILNHSTANDQALYWQMKRYSGENGKCFATQKTLMKKLGIGKQAYRKSLNYLLKKKWIKFIGTTQGKTRPIKTYSIVDIWKLNILHYKEISSEMAVSFKKDKSQNLRDKSQNGTKISPRMDIEEEHILKNNYKNNIAKDKLSPSKAKKNPIKINPLKEIDLDTEINKLLADKQRHIHIIGIWLKEYPPSINTHGAVQSSIKRNVRAAKLLEGYPDNKIIDTMNYVAQEAETLKYDCSLETIVKKINLAY